MPSKTMMGTRPKFDRAGPQMIAVVRRLSALPGVQQVSAPIAGPEMPHPKRHTQLSYLALRFEGEHAGMGVDEDVELITGILLVMGLLPFALAWLERTLDEPSTPRRRGYRRHR